MGCLQLPLLGHEPPALDRSLSRITRVQLDEEAWVDHLPSWVRGHQALYEHLEQTTRWRAAEREMYDRVVEVPRLLAGYPDDGAGHPLIDTIAAALEERYGVPFTSRTAALYRHGGDSVAWHGDTWAKHLPLSWVATVSLGAPRRFLLRPAPGRPGRLHSFRLGWGDLVVMGGTCQRTWQHCVPKARRADPRMALMFRPREDPFEQEHRSVSVYERGYRTAPADDPPAAPGRPPRR